MIVQKKSNIEPIILLASLDIVIDMKIREKDEDEEKREDMRRRREIQKVILIDFH